MLYVKYSKTIVLLSLVPYGYSSGKRKESDHKGVNSYKTLRDSRTNK